MNAREYEQKINEEINAERYKEATQLAQEMAESGMPRGILLQAQILYLQDRTSVAASKIDQYLRYRPDDAEGWYWAGVYNDNNAIKEMDCYEHAAMLGNNDARNILPVIKYSRAIDQWNASASDDFDAQKEAVNEINDAIELIVERMCTQPHTYPYSYALCNMYEQLHMLAKNGQLTLTNVTVNTVDEWGNTIKTEKYTTRNYLGNGNIWDLKNQIDRQKDDSRKKAQSVTTHAMANAALLDHAGDHEDAAMLRLKIKQMMGKGGGVPSRWFWNYAQKQAKQSRGKNYSGWLKDYMDTASINEPVRPAVQYELRAQEEGVLKQWLTEWFGDEDLVPDDALDYLDKIDPDAIERYHAAEQLKEAKRQSKEERNKKSPSLRKVLIEQAASVPVKVMPTIAGALLQFFVPINERTAFADGFSPLGIALFIIGLILTIVGTAYFHRGKDEDTGRVISAYIGQLLLYFLFSMSMIVGLIILVIVWLANRKKI